MNKIKIEILIVVRVVGVIENSKSLVHVIFVCTAYDLGVRGVQRECYTLICHKIKTVHYINFICFISKF
jgi:hypothetical protein